MPAFRNRRRSCWRSFSQLWKPAAAKGTTSTPRGIHVCMCGPWIVFDVWCYIREETAEQAKGWYPFISAASWLRKLLCILTSFWWIRQVIGLGPFVVHQIRSSIHSQIRKGGDGVILHHVRTYWTNQIIYWIMAHWALKSESELTETICRHSAVMSKSYVADDLYSLYRDEDIADIAFSAETRVFHAHKAIFESQSARTSWTRGALWHNKSNSYWKRGARHLWHHAQASKIFMSLIGTNTPSKFWTRWESMASLSSNQ